MNTTARPASIRALWLGAAPLADLVCFNLALHAGVAPGTAHLTSFAVAAMVALGLHATGVYGPAGTPRTGRRVVLVAAVYLLALLLRGGVLLILMQGLGIPAGVAIVGAIATSVFVIYRGTQLTLPALPQEGWGDAGGRNIVLALIFYAVALRLAYLGALELLPEEAYYWNYAQHLDIGYLDHPPMVAWLIRATTGVLGEHGYAVRLGAVACSGVASYFVYRSAREFFGHRSALLALLLMQVLPTFFLAGLLMTPDAPLTAAWAAAVYFLQQALLRGRTGAWWGAGIAIGLGLLSKYTIALLFPATLLFLVFDRQSRAWLGRIAPYAAAMLSIALFCPVIIWNAHHEWASFAFQTSRRLAEAPKFSLHKLLASVIVLLGPVALLGLPAALRNGTGDMASESARRARFTTIFTLTPLSVFVLFSLNHEVKFDWTAALWVSAVPALAALLASPGAALGRLAAWYRAAFVPSVLVVLILYGLFLHYLTLGIPGLRYGRQLQGMPVAWADLGGQVSRLADDMTASSGAAPLVVGMNRYMLASELSFYSRAPRTAAHDTASQNLFGPSGLMYELWLPEAAARGRTLLLVAWDRGELDDTKLRAYATGLGPLCEGSLSRNGRVIGRYYYRTAQEYHGAQQEPPAAGGPG